ncbi:cation:proton antiporter [Adhaeribacter sp. BT258]|uniref:Cation:proton antiporter n=1 Tax=Adhaeribacter terrigena TaxID=2793070 RepID=A0ABS1BYT4_9BACT|nr:cation:proton antiporter [Adhaeribacter terrigena]MBK0402270.1 cation:proton antiporter [Adhaeribacter terrigena]
MEIPLLADIIIMLGLAVFVILIFQKLRLPTILGLLITGLIAGPSGLNLVKASHEVEMLSEIGVILLLFIIGLEFSLKELMAIKKYVLIGGAIQVFATILAVNLIGHVLGFSTSESLFLGFLFSLSSTAIVLKILQDRREINSPHGRMILAILIFQDIIVVPMMLVTPLMAGKSENILFSVIFLVLKGLLIVAIVYVSARYVVPKLLFQITKTRSKELFLLSTIVICLAVAGLTSSMGLSLSLGAFLAGLIISESEYSHQATSNIIPFREVFSSFFFVSIGMLLDVQFLTEHIGWVLFFTLLTFVVNSFMGGIASFVLGFPTRTAILVGFALFQVGEFAFILSKVGLENGLMNNLSYQYFLSVSVLTMAFTPFVISQANPFATWVLRHLPKGWVRAEKQTRMADEYNDHIVIIGYGLTGRHIARVARQVGIPYNILELNSETVRRERSKGEPIFYGDAVHPIILNHLGIQQARIAVVAISDAKATKQTVANIRSLSSTVHIIARTSFVTEMAENYRMGADEVIPEELETSIEIFTRVLDKYLVPRDEIMNFIDRIRSGNYSMMRSLQTTEFLPSVSSLHLTGMTTAALKTFPENKQIVGRTLQESDLRARYGITILAIKRQETLIEEVDHNTFILAGDLLYVFGRKENLILFERALKASEELPETSRQPEAEDLI